MERAARVAGSASPAAYEVRALVYDTAAALLSRVGEPFLAWAAADRAMFAAEHCSARTRVRLLAGRRTRSASPLNRPATGS